VADKQATLTLRIKEIGGAALDRVQSALDNLKGVALGVFGAISAVVVKSISEYRQSEEATNALSRAMVNQGIYSKQLKEDYLAQAAALQNVTTFADEQIVSAQAVIQGYIGQTKVSNELIKATLDLAAVKKIDLASAADLVGKTIGTSTNALARNGIEVNANATKQEKLAQVIAGINSKWAGQAETAAQGLGVLKQLENVASELFETIGQRLAPVVVLFSQKIKDIGTDVSIVNPIIDSFVSSLQFLLKVGVGIAGVFELVGKVIGTEVAQAVETVSALMDGQFSRALEIQKQRIQTHGQTITEVYDATARRMAEIDKAFLASKQENIAQEEALVAESNARKLQKQDELTEQEKLKIEEAELAKQEMRMLNFEAEMAGQDANDVVRLQKLIAALDKEIATQTDHQKKMEMIKRRGALVEQQIQAIAHQNMIKDREDTGRTIATLAQSNNKTLAAIGKAAAITQIAIDTPVAISKALAAFPPPINFAAAGAVGVAMAAQAARIAGVQLAEGGVVMPRPGGIQATIGEGGQPEAVIPLDRFGEFGLGGGPNVNITFTGPVLGDESQAREFAKAVDRELLKLRQGNESVAFDEGVI